MTVPWYFWPLVLIPVVAITLTTAATVFKRRGSAALGFAALWLAWTAMSLLLAVNDVFRQGTGIVRLVGPLGLVVGGTVLLVALSRIPAVAAQLHDAAVKFVAPQAYRVAGAVFLIAMALGLLPPLFALPAGLGDITVGIAAFYLLMTIRRQSRKSLVWFNILGLLDLVVAVGIGATAGPGPAQLIHITPSTLAVTLAPLVLIPTVAVPLVAALHVISLIRLREPSPAQHTVQIGHEPYGQLHGM